MLRTVIAFFLVIATPAGAQPVEASVKVAPGAKSLFERDWVLANWALKYFDVNGDIMLEPAEARAAAERFRELADGNGDGRVTPDEYRKAREHILAQY